MNLLGIDIGGTKIAVCIGNEKGTVQAARRFPTDANDPKATLERAAQIANELVEEAGLTLEQIRAVGISSPGLMCSKRRMILKTPNLKGWDHFKIGDFFDEKLNRPVWMQNDANGAGLAEYLFGAQKGKDLIYLTMSTGIGAGIVIHGEVLSGNNDLGGEVGHITLDPNGPLCGCGKTGCWESYCGGKNFADRIREDIANNNVQTAILDVVDGDLGKINIQAIRVALRAGDEYAVEKWDVFIEKMAHAVGILLQCFNPEAIIMGTLAIHGGDTFIPQMIERIPKYAWKEALDVCTIEASALKNIGELSALAVALDGVQRESQNIEQEISNNKGKKYARYKIHS